MTAEKQIERSFTGPEGRPWIATVEGRSGADYKGRFHLVLRAGDDPEGRPLPLEDLRWNGRHTAERTLRTMSEVELRRRLRSALGRNRILPMPNPASPD